MRIIALLTAVAVVPISVARAQDVGAAAARRSNGTTPVVTLEALAVELQAALAARGVKTATPNPLRPQMPVTIPVKPPDKDQPPAAPPPKVPAPPDAPPPSLPPSTPFPNPPIGPFMPAWPQAFDGFRDGADRYLQEATSRRDKGQMSQQEYGAAVAEYQRLLDIYQKSMTLRGAAKP